MSRFGRLASQDATTSVQTRLSARDQRALVGREGMASLEPRIPRPDREAIPLFGRRGLLLRSALQGRARRAEGAAAIIGSHAHLRIPLPKPSPVRGLPGDVG